MTEHLQKSEEERRAETFAGCVLKLGGSVITVKGDPRLLVREKALKRIAQEMASLPRSLRPKVLIHGAGSFGHQIVARTRIHERVESHEDRLAWAETQILQNELNTRVCRIFLDKGIPAVPYQASSAGWTQKGSLEGLELYPLERLVEEGLVPVLYGVPAVERTGGCRILSGDALAVAVAKRLGLAWIFHGTDVDGVYNQDPKTSLEKEDFKKPKRWSAVSRHNWEEVRLGLAGSANPDVTGGMAGKVNAALNLSKEGIAARIFDATRPGAIKEALQGESLGTVIKW